MKLPSIEDLRLLASEQSPPCLTISMPTHADGRHVAVDATLFRDLLRQAERRLDLPPPQRSALLEPLRALDTQDFWTRQAGGLALFRSRDAAAFFRLDHPLAEEVHVGRAFRLRPLLTSLRDSTRYLLLTLSQHQVALHEGTLRGLRPVEVLGLPHSMAEALGPEWRERFVSAHSRGPGALAFHGQGGASEDAKSDVVRFFRRVDEELWPVLRDGDLPLVLAGVEHYHALYRQVTRYRHLAPDGVIGSVERDTPAQLLARVRPVVERLAAAREEEALADLERLERRGRGLRAADAIARAAVQGRVRRLLVAEGAGLVGEVDRVTGAVTRHDSTDLLDELTELVLLRGGEVLALPSARMPGGSLVAATLRW